MSCSERPRRSSSSRLPMALRLPHEFRTALYFGAGVHNNSFAAKPTHCRFDARGVSSRAVIVAIDEHAEYRRFRKYFVQESDVLFQELGGKECNSGDISTRAVDGCH